MGSLKSRRCLAFSFIEVIMAMTILSLLVGISVRTYNDGIEQSKNDTAVQHLHYIANAIQRWEMSKNSKYSYASLRPLEGEFLKNMGADPWGNEYAINPESRVVYSAGPSGAGTGNGGLAVAFDTDRDVPPAAPSNFTVKRDNTQIDLTWDPPVLNIDGSLIDNDLKTYKLFVRTSTEATWTATHPGSLTSLDEPANSAQVLWNDVVTQGDTVYFHLRAVDNNGNISPPSVPAGIFVVQETIPVINYVNVSPVRCPLNTPFNVKIDVSDGDANLDWIKVSGGANINETWDFGGGSLDNRFHPVLSFTYTPTATESEFDLTISAKDIENAQVDYVYPIKIAFTNEPPRINTLSPGNYNITVNPNADEAIPEDYVDVTYLIEATDGESNIVELKLESSVAYDPGPTGVADNPLSKTWTYTGAGVSMAVESFTWSVLPRKDQEIIVKVTAKDKDGAIATVKQGKLRFSEDKTAPQHVTYWMDKSNPLLAQENFHKWWIRDRSDDLDPNPTDGNNQDIDTPYLFEADCWSWENESPPVSYYMAISTTNPGNLLDLTDFLSAAITRDSTGAKWIKESSDGAAKFILKPGDGLIAGTPFDPTLTYYTVLKAKNSVGILSDTTAIPLHHSLKISQNGFGYDATDPDIVSITIDSLGPVADHIGDVWFNGKLDASWITEDYVDQSNHSKGFGSGAKLWEYYILREEIDGATQVRYRPVEENTYITLRSPELRAIELDTNMPNARYVLKIRARDVAGNMSDFYEAGAQLDLTAPTTHTSGLLPVIENADVSGYIYAPNTIIGSWNNVFVEPESGIESYDWGVSTTDVLDGAIPDVVPWQRVEGFNETGSFVQNEPPLLTDGIAVYLCLRARNYAGIMSDVAYSIPAQVDVTMYTNFSASPRVGHNSVSIAFTASVTGGDEPFDYNFLFDGDYSDSSRQFLLEGSPLSEITSSFTYNISSFGPGRHSARVKIQDSKGVLSIQDIYFELYPDPMVLAVFDESFGTLNRMAFFQSSNLDSPLWRSVGVASSNQTPIGLELGPEDRFAIIPMYNGGSTPGYIRLTLNGDYAASGESSNFRDLEFDVGMQHHFPQQVKACSISPDGSYALFAGNGILYGSPNTEEGWVFRVLLNPMTGVVYGHDLGLTTGWGTPGASTSIKMNDIELWDGGRSGIVGVEQSTAVGLTHGGAAVELGFSDYIDVELSKYFGTNSTNDLRGIVDVAASPDDNWLAISTNGAYSHDIYLAETFQLAGSSGEKPTTYVDHGPVGGFSNIAWMPGSDRFIVGHVNSGSLYSCNVTTFSAELNLDAITSLPSAGATVIPSSVNFIDISDDGDQILLCDPAGKRLFRGDFTAPLTITWQERSASKPKTPVAARFIKPLNYGAPVIKSFQTIGLGAGSWSIHFTGANLFNTTNLKIVKTPSTPSTLFDGALSSKGSAVYSTATIQFDPSGPVSGDPYSFTFSNVPGGGPTTLTTSIIFNHP